MIRVVALFLIVLSLSCSTKEVKTPQNEAITPPLKPIIAEPVVENCIKEDSLVEFYKLVDVQELNPAIRVKLRYSDTANFLHTDLYGCLENAYLQPRAAQKLAKAQFILTSIDSNLHLLVWDAVRPRSTQWKMWYTLQMLLEQKVRYVSNPRNGSIHNYGFAVDLTICDAKGIELDMGTDFDFFGKKANTNNERFLLKTGILSKQQLNNRWLLRTVMKDAGFTTISSEWWHFNALSRSVAAADYPIVE